MARFSDRSKLLEILAETPIVSFACKKVGIDRRTYYRWRDSNKKFRDDTDKILSIGRMATNDKAEAVIMKLISQDNLKAAEFWLRFNHPSYRPVRTTYVDPIAHKHSLEPGEICNACGYVEPKVELGKDGKPVTRINEIKWTIIDGEKDDNKEDEK